MRVCVCVCAGEGPLYFYLSDTKQGDNKKQLQVYNPNKSGRLIHTGQES